MIAGRPARKLPAQRLGGIERLRVHLDALDAWRTAIESIRRGPVAEIA